MSIDLSNITEIRDKIGVVTKITDASDRVLWSAAKPEVTITVTGAGSSDCVRIYHIENNWEGYYEPTTFTAKIGDTISCELIECWYSQYLYINGEMVEGGYGENDIHYTYTVVSDAVIDLYQYDGSTKREREGKITITEVPEGHALLSIDYSNPEQFSTSVDGVSYNDTTITVPIGSVVEISAFNLSCNKKCSYGSASVYINDNLVASESERIDYSYTVRGNTAIASYVNPSYCRDCDNYAYDAIINITEQ